MGTNGRTRDELEADARAAMAASSAPGSIDPPPQSGLPILPLPAFPTLGYHVDTDTGRKVAVVLAVHTHYGVQVYALPKELAAELGRGLIDHAGNITELEIVRELPPHPGG